MSQQVDPSHIMQVGMGFWASKTLLSAVELELFTKLGSDGMTGSQIAETLELHARAIPDFPDALVALELLEREGEGKDALYRNTQATAVFLDKRSPAYIGGIFEMSENDAVSKVPLLGDIPFAGNLFKQTTRSSSKQELLFFITPKMIADRSAAR